MSLSFPSAPTPGQIYQGWKWSGSSWDPVPSSVYALASQVIPHCGRLNLVSPTQLNFPPWLGDQIKINGSLYTISVASPPSVTNAGLTGQTLYYVYIYWTGSALALECSTTTHVNSVQPGNVGVRIKSGDNTRTLVGMVYTSATTTFVSSPNNSYVRSWFNRASTNIGYAFTNSSVAAPTWTALAAIAILIWLDEQIIVMFTGYLNNNTAGATGMAGLAYQQSTGAIIGQQQAYVAVANANVPISMVSPVLLPEGIVVPTIYGYSFSGTTSFSGNLNAIVVAS